MKVKLTTGTEYDLSDKTRAKNLVNNICVMKSREQFDRLLSIYQQVKPYESYTGSDASRKEACRICHILFPILQAENLISLSVPSISRRFKTSAPDLEGLKFATKKEVVVSPPHESKAPNGLNKQQGFLGLPRKLLDDAKPNYIISMAPINSSGDIYHIAAFLLLSLAKNYQIPSVMLTYDAGTTKAQAERSLLFVEMLDLSSYFMSISQINTDSNCHRQNKRQAELHNYFSTQREIIYYVDQKVLTNILAGKFIKNKKKTTLQLRASFKRRNSELFPQKINNEIQNITSKWLNQIKKTIVNGSLIILHLRYSANANEVQNFEDGFIARLKKYLEEKGLVVWFIITDSRLSKSFTGIRKNRISPFSRKILERCSKIKNHDYGKILHLEILDQLLDLPQLKGVVGNTSGTLDLAAFLGHRVFNIHQFTYPDIDYQDYRILLQVSFFTVENYIEKEYNDFLNLRREREGNTFSDEDLNQLLPSFIAWLNKSDTKHVMPHGISVNNVNLKSSGFWELCFIATWRKKDDQRNFKEAIKSNSKKSPLFFQLPVSNTTEHFIKQLSSVQKPSQSK